MADKPEGKQIDPGELQVAYLAVRRHADKSAYGKWISNEECRSVANEVVIAVENYRNGEVI